jgi:predicted N-acetyltransferase YhbS
MDIQLVETLTAPMQESIHAILLTHNQTHNGVFFTAREEPKHASRPLHVVAFDKSGHVIGGLIGETQFAWLKVLIMAVAIPHRGKGIGKYLLRRAEEAALSRGCRHAYVDTMDYQAPTFYTKQGYQTAGKLENWDSHGHAKYFFTKNLTDASMRA